MSQHAPVDENDGTAVKPLAGITVLDVSRVVSGPTCCFWLAALGAEVIRIEAPGGDVTWIAPPFVGPDGVHRGVRGPRDIAVSALRKGRGKRSVVLDLKSAGGRDAFVRLVERADVLVENFTPGVMAALGLAYDDLVAHNDGLVYCSITGFGPDGPYRDRPSMDLVVQAMSGLMAKTGFPDGPPTKVGATIGDQLPGVFAALGIVAALRQRDRDPLRRGQIVDVAMFDALVALVWDEPVDDYEAQGFPMRVGNADSRGAPLDAYPTADGWITVVIVSDSQWDRMARLLDRADLAERYPTIRLRGEARDEINGVVADWCRSRSTVEVAAAFERIEIPSGVVAAPWSAPRDPQVVHRGSLERLGHPDLTERSPYHGPVLPLRLSRADVRATTPAEPLGTSTEAVLRDIAGYTDAEIAELRRSGALG